MMPILVVCEEMPQQLMTATMRYMKNPTTEVIFHDENVSIDKDTIQVTHLPAMLNMREPSLNWVQLINPREYRTVSARQHDHLPRLLRKGFERPPFDPREKNYTDVWQRVATAQWGLRTRWVLKALSTLPDHYPAVRQVVWGSMSERDDRIRHMLSSSLHDVWKRIIGPTWAHLGRTEIMSCRVEDLCKHLLTHDPAMQMEFDDEIDVKQWAACTKDPVDGYLGFPAARYVTRAVVFYAY
jgi:hypothetical protein